MPPPSLSSPHPHTPDGSLPFLHHPCISSQLPLLSRSFIIPSNISCIYPTPFSYPPLSTHFSPLLLLSPLLRHPCISSPHAPVSFLSFNHDSFQHFLRPSHISSLPSVSLATYSSPFSPSLSTPSPDLFSLPLPYQHFFSSAISSLSFIHHSLQYFLRPSHT